MLKPRAQSKEGPRRKDPNLFTAARANDIVELSEALSAGKQLDEVDFEDGFTPLHTAAFNGSGDYLREALRHHSANPWLRDHQGYLAIDHADARRDYEISRLLYEAMYPGGAVPLAEPE
ncbi:ankyrin repeat domain-containing protein [Hyphomicrobium zavarzinii]|uniref:ankyrin repeat domain-containing protein n=1 Tax=Hyphomicrobium zavarzinii TaxID=48292 RepID=UPI0003A01660|nr:ankyrin repeat domain-containing protein [Hyphomicrobium zavarzinii]